MRVTVVIPATNAPPTLDRCVAAIAASTLQPDEVIVVDAPAGAGPAAARNAGLERTTSEVVVFVDSDVVVAPDALARILRHFEDDQELVAVFGSYDDAVATGDIVSGFRNLLHHVIHHRHPGPAQTFWAGLGAVRRPVALAVGGFDAARYAVPSIEDIELGGRLARVGTVLLDPTIQGTHLKRWSLWSMVATDFSRRGVPWVELLAEHRTKPATLNIGPRERISALSAVVAGAALLRRRPLVAGAALACQVALNRDLYAVLLRRLGPRGAAAACGLHTLHQLTAAAAVPVGLARHARRRRRAPDGSAPPHVPTTTP